MLLAAVFALVTGCSRSPGSLDQSDVDRPNVIIIFADDMGYGDVGVYGAEGFETPNLDRMAEEGMRFTSFYVPAVACTQSRAALLTGRYPMRVGLPYVIFPQAKIGLNSDELTIAEVLRERGYATAALGKWHLGAHPDFLPTSHGFDQFFGLPYSNDMSPDPKNNPREEVREQFPPLPLIEDTTVVEREPDQAALVDRYLDRAVDFIDRNQDRPFFLYLAHHFPHVPLFATERFEGRTEHGLYGDVISEIDWLVGQIVGALEERDLRRRTLILFTSDNGPWLIFGDHGGSAGPLREGKVTTFEGGHRVPAIVSWPGRIPGGRVSDVMVTSMDVLPTVAGLAGAELPDDRVIDGYDVWPILSGASEAETPYEAFYYYQDRQLQAVRSGPWKLHVPHSYLGLGKAGQGGDVGEYAERQIELSLFNLETDVEESRNVADEHPDVVARLTRLIEQGAAKLGDALTDVRGSDQGEPGRIEESWDQLGLE